MAYQSRSAWTSRPNRAVRTKLRQVHFTWHYPGFGTDSIKTAAWPHDRCLRQIDTWERQHQARGSKNIEYNLFACAHGYLIEGRGDRQNGANGKSAFNRPGMSCQVLIGDNERLTPGHRSAMREAVAWGERKHPGMTSTQYGHRHWVGTRCPGPYVMAEIPVRAGLPISGGGATVPRPSVPASTPSSPVFADVDKTQAWLRDLGYDPGTIDGKYGTRTQAATRQAQHDLGITPADGKPGPATRTILEDAVSKLDTIIEQNKQNQWRLDTMPQRILDEPVDLEGAWKGQKSTLRRMRAWYAEDLRQIKEGVATSRAAVLKAVQETGKAQGLTDAQVQAIASAAAEAAARVSAEDVAGQLEVTVTKGE